LREPGDLLRARHAEHPGEPREPARGGNEPELDLGEPERRPRTDDTEIARERELEPAADRGPLHGGDRHEWSGRERLERALAPQVGDVFDRPFRDLGQVRSGAEGAFTGRRDDDDRGFLAERLDALCERLEMRAIVGVRALGAIEDQPAEPVVDLRPDAQENLRGPLSRPARPVLRAAGAD
jgi:hypothetical protein